MQTESIAEQLFFTTIRVDTIAQNGGSGSGTAFFFNYRKGEENYPFVVTNKHVVAGMREGVLSFLKRQDQTPQLGQGLQLRIDGWQDVLFGHPKPEIDIAICPLRLLRKKLKSNMAQTFSTGSFLTK